MNYGESAVYQTWVTDSKKIIVLIIGLAYYRQKPIGTDLDAPGPLSETDNRKTDKSVGRVERGETDDHINLRPSRSSGAHDKNHHKPHSSTYFHSDPV
jgi:hypothetical protein